MSLSWAASDRTSASVALTLVLGFGLSACSNDDTTTPGPASNPIPSIIRAHFELPAEGVPKLLDVPFPSDVYLDEAGEMAEIPGANAIFPKRSNYLFTSMAQNRGFATVGGAMFLVDDTRSSGDAGPKPAAIDPASLPQDEDASIAADATAMLVDLEATDPSMALVRARADYVDDYSLGAPVRPTITVYPARGIVLKDHHRYAAVLTTGIKTKDGQAVGPSPMFQAIRDGQRTTSAEKAYGDAIDKAASLVPALSDKTAIATLTFYTTTDQAHELIDLRAEIAKAPAPPLSWDAADLLPMGSGLFANDPLPAGYVATLDAWLGAPAKLADGTDDPADEQTTGKGHDEIAAVGTAVFQATNFLQSFDEGYDNLAHATFARDASGKVIANPDKPTSKIWATIILPSGAVPPSGFPTVIMQHGLSSDRKFALSIANTFAKKGWATVAIESVTFGARAADPTKTVDEHAAWPWSTGPGAYDGPDGFVDKNNGPEDFFGLLKNLGALRDQMRQSILDLGTLVEVVRDPALDLGPLLAAVPGAKLDPDRLAYLGDSLGGAMGALLAAVEPHVKTFVLNVAGGGLAVELANAPYIASQLALGGGFNFQLGSEIRYAPGNPVVQVMQHVVGPADPLALARHILLEPAGNNPAKSVLQVEVIWDELMCNEAGEALARAAGFALAEPSTGSRAGVPLSSATPTDGAVSNAPTKGLTAVVVQTSPATHGSNMIRRQGQHEYKHPWAQFDQVTPFTRLETPFSIDEPYVATQDMIVHFLEGAFSGAVPAVRGLPAPVLDFDGDGALDKVDADPNDPSKK